MPRGVIEEFEGSYGSGIATLVVSGERLLVDNGQTVRALDAAFGGVIGPGHTVNTSAIIGKEIDYYTDGLGMMVSFSPVEE